MEKYKHFLDIRCNARHTFYHVGHYIITKYGYISMIAIDRYAKDVKICSCSCMDKFWKEIRSNYIHTYLKMANFLTILKTMSDIS